MEFPHLFSAASIGSMTLPNRIIMGSMHLGFEGLPGATGRMAEFYAARARGGAALLITGGCAINAEAIGGGQFSRIDRPEDLESLRQVAARVHQDNGRIGLQLFHAGRYATREWLFGLQPVAPSALRCSLHPTTPRAMTEEDILRTIHDFGEAGKKAQDAGFDCVEIMGSEGYLVNQFFSPLTNKREDDWGGSLQNRMRFSLEVLRSVRKQCGKGFPVIYRISGIDLMPNSSSWQDTYAWAAALQEAGADAFNIGIGWHESRLPTISMLVPRAYYSFVSERIKKRVSIPCICSNRINDPAVAEQILAEEKADFVSMARPLLADADFPNKASSGRAAFVNTCIACNQACLDNAFRNEPTACILNPEAGREQQMTIQPATHRKNIAVVGAGPAGLEACRVLGARGHRVTLFEKQDRIGGQLLYAVQVPGKQEFLNTIRYYKNYLEESGVRAELGHAPSSTELESFDAIVIATGAKPRLPSIPGSDFPFCMDYDAFFERKLEPGSSAVIIGAGGIGCDIAHILTDNEHAYPPVSFFDDPGNVSQYEEHLRSIPRSRSISLTRRGKRIGEKLGATTRWALIQLLENRGVQMHTQVEYKSISAAGLHATSRSGKDILIPADTIIFATGQTSHQPYEEIAARHPECHVIGSAYSASESNCQSAIRQAADIARKL